MVMVLVMTMTPYHLDHTGHGDQVIGPPPGFGPAGLGAGLGAALAFAAGFGSFLAAVFFGFVVLAIGSPRIVPWA